MNVGSIANGILQNRTKQLSLRVLNLCRSLPNGRVENMIANQLMRYGTSVGANYRPACRARSPADFRAKLGIVEEEADEAVYWMELIGDCQIVKRERLIPLRQEAEQILAMVVPPINTSRRISR